MASPKGIQGEDQAATAGRLGFRGLGFKGLFAWYGFAGSAYSECLKIDHMVELLRLEAFGKVKTGAKLEGELEALSSKMVVPEMPNTSAVLDRIPASESHPGAIYRLAGDRFVF